jgi:dienelactone hydrolase
MIERAITVHTPHEDVAGLLWLPDSHQPAPLILAGHGFTQHKRALFPPRLASHLTSRGFAVACIDAPCHGDRTPDASDGAAIDAAWRAHWREFGASRIALEHAALIDSLSTLPAIDTERIGWFGLSLGTQYGIGLLAKEPRIRAAVLGLSALPQPGPRMTRYTPRVRCPVFFIQQLNDEIAVAERARALFDLIGSEEKTLRSSPGGHIAVPRAVFDEAYDFLARHLL